MRMRDSLWNIRGGRERKRQTLSPEASVLNLMGSVCREWERLQAQGTSGQRLLRKWKEEEERSEACALCGRATPLSVSITGGVRVTLHLGPQLLCGVCDISCCNGNGGPSLTGGTLHWPAHISSQREVELLFPQGGGRMWAQNWTHDNKQPPPSLKPPLSTFQAQGMTFLSPKLQKSNGIWTLRLFSGPKQSFHSLGSMMGLFPPVNRSRNLQLLPLLLRVINWISLLFSPHTLLSVTRLKFSWVDGFSFFLFHGVLIFKADGVRPCPPQWTPSPEKPAGETPRLWAQKRGLGLPNWRLSEASSEPPLHFFTGVCFQGFREDAREGVFRWQTLKSKVEG